jgi:hypothetical protein
VSTALFLEYEDVLRPEQREVHALDPSAISKALKELAALCEPVEPHFSWRPQLSDPADETVLCSSRHWLPLLAGILKRYAVGSSLIEHGNGDEHEGNHLGLARQEIGAR